MLWYNPGCEYCGKKLTGSRWVYCSDQCMKDARSAKDGQRRAERRKERPDVRSCAIYASNRNQLRERCREQTGNLEAGYIVYGLQDPLSQAIRYVGFSNMLARRVEEHMNNVEGSLSKNRWIAELRQKGLVPNLVILETTGDEQTAREAERRWIDHGRGSGWPLTNGKAAIGQPSNK